MLRHFISLVDEAVSEGHQRGFTLFRESLELDLQKEQIFEEAGLNGIMMTYLKEAGYEVDDEIDEDEIDEDKLDSLLNELEKEE